MKKLFKVSMAVAIGLTLTLAGCKKTTTTTDSTTNTGGTVPTNFTQKALIEEFTGEWCGFCPDGALAMESNIALAPNTTYGIAIHDADPMALGDDAGYYKPTFKVTSFPTGMINRAVFMGTNSYLVDRGNWGKAIYPILNKTAPCGLQIEYTKEDAMNYDVKVSVAFNQDMTSPVYLTVAMVEDSVAAVAQHNYYSSADPNFHGAGGPSHPLYNKPASFGPKDWSHMNVLRSFSGMGKVEGELMDSTLTKKGKVFSNTYLFNVNPNMVAAHCKIVAYVHYKGSAAVRDILNVQGSALGVNKKWD